MKMMKALEEKKSNVFALRFEKENEANHFDNKELFAKIAVESVTSFFTVENFEGSYLALGNMKFALEFDAVF